MLADRRNGKATFSAEGRDLSEKVRIPTVTVLGLIYLMFPYIQGDNYTF